MIYIALYSPKRQNYFSNAFISKLVSFCDEYFKKKVYIKRHLLNKMQHKITKISHSIMDDLLETYNHQEEELFLVNVIWNYRRTDWSTTSWNQKQNNFQSWCRFKRFKLISSINASRIFFSSSNNLSLATVQRWHDIHIIWIDNALILVNELTPQYFPRAVEVEISWIYNDLEVELGLIAQ